MAPKFTRICVKKAPKGGDKYECPAILMAEAEAENEAEADMEGETQHEFKTGSGRKHKKHRTAMLNSSAPAGDAVANKSNVIKEENYYLLQWLYRIRRVGCARGLLIGFLRPDFLWSIYRPMMRSAKLSRTDGDIKVAVNLWCDNPAAAEKRYGHISDWDVSSVTDMSKLFLDKSEFNDDISRWDVSSVTNMSEMFIGAYAFNQPVGDWDVSEVTNMSAMFCGAHAFDQPIGGWDVSKVTDMQYMFCRAYDFNQPIGDWDVSKVKDMSDMFCHAYDFNQDLTRWDMRSVRDTRGMLDHTHSMQGNNKPGSLRRVIGEQARSGEGQ